MSEQHLENNTYDETAAAATTQGQGQQQQLLATGEAVRVIVVNIKDVRISDFKGNVRDLALVSENGGLVNGAS